MKKRCRNDLLSLRDRSLVTITSLISQGITDSSLKYHLPSAKNNGITRTEAAEIITHIAFYAGGQHHRNIASSKGCHEVYLVFVVNSSIEPNNPDGSRGDSFVKNLKHPTVFLPLEGRGVPLLSHSGIFAI